MSDRSRESSSSPDDSIDVLVVGAGPTGLTLAAQLAAFSIRCRIIDRSLDRARESRALGVQARTLEIFQSLNLGEALVARGNRSARLVLHFEGGAVAEGRLADFGAADTRFPFILFVSQAETEAVLGERLAAAGLTVERGIELVDATQSPERVRCLLRRRDGREEQLDARYLVGCDGAHSTVRKRFSIPFNGDAYLQDFLLGDIEVDGPLEPNTLHSFAGRHGVAMFFPLGSPATWRVIAMSGRSGRQTVNEPGTELAAPGGGLDESMTTDLSLDELQAVVDGATGGGSTLRDPAWLTHFRLHHRQASRYRVGRVFLAGDAAHIHSPVGAQGMNTGIQDAWNLGWKLALVARGAAVESLLDSYEAERWPVGRTLLRYTDRAFAMFTRAMSAGPLAAWIRRTVGPRVASRVLGSARIRGLIFRFVSELGIRYRKSPAVREGQPRLRIGPAAGDRLPDAQILSDGRRTYLQQQLAGPCLHLLLCGPMECWNRNQVAELRAAYAGLLVVHYLDRHHAAGVLVDSAGEALSRLGVRDGDPKTAQYLVRPDGYIGFRSGGAHLAELAGYLREWFSAHR